MRVDALRICLTLLLIVAVSSAAAQELPTPSETTVEASPSGSFSEVVDVHVVSVEVVVTDRDGQPVTDLTREDFRIFEDGEPMTVTNFFAVDGGLPETTGADESAATELEPAVLPEEATRDLQLVVVIDNLQIRPENRKNLFDRLRQYLRDNGDLAHSVSVAAMNRRLQVVLPFTDDLEQVFEALDEQEKATSYQALIDGERRMMMARMQNASLRRYSPMEVIREGQSIRAGGDPDFNDAVLVAMNMADNVRALGERRYQMTRSSIQALGSLCETLGGLPGRKALLYLSDGLPQRPADSLAHAWAGKYEGWFLEVEPDIRRNSRFPDAASRFRDVLNLGISNAWDLRHELEALAEQASVNRVTFYPISASGRGTAGFMSAEHTGTGNVSSTTGSMLRSATTEENFTRDSSLLLLAEDTGGVATLRSTDLDGLLDRMRQDFHNFYSLGYSPPHGGEDGEYHRVRVEVLREGLEVRHVEGYRNKSWRKSLGELTLAAALYGSESNPLGVRVDRGEPVADGKNFVVPIKVKIPFPLIRLVHRDQHFNAQLTLLVLVSDEEDGGLSKTQRFDLPIKIPDARVLEAMVQVATYPIELKMNRGKKRIAVGVHDHISKEMSAVKYDLVLGR